MKGTASVVPFVFSQFSTELKIFLSNWCPNDNVGNMIVLVRTASGGCCQWVLAAACEAVE
jgi:hypothetical protein